MKIKITKNELLILFQNLNHEELLEYRGLKFVYALNKNIERLGPDVNAIKKTVGLPKDVMELISPWRDMSRDEIIENVKNSPDKALADKALDRLDQNEKFLSEEIEVEVFGIHMDNLPGDIKNEHYKALKKLITEDEAESNGNS